MTSITLHPQGSQCLLALAFTHLALGLLLYGHLFYIMPACYTSDLCVCLQYYRGILHHWGCQPGDCPRPTPTSAPLPTDSEGESSDSHSTSFGAPTTFACVIKPQVWSSKYEPIIDNCLKNFWYPRLVTTFLGLFGRENILKGPMCLIRLSSYLFG